MAITSPKANTSSTQVDISSLIGDIGSLAQLFTGKTTAYSGGSETTTKSISIDSANALVKQMLEGSSGLASIAGAEKASGLYNTTVNQMLINDLMARAAAAVSEKNSTSTTIKTPFTTRQMPQIDPTRAILGLAGPVIGKKILDKTGISKAIDSSLNKIGTSITDALGITNSSASFFLNTFSSGLILVEEIFSTMTGSALSSSSSFSAFSNAGAEVF